jgi:hypothetical protein
MRAENWGAIIGTKIFLAPHEGVPFGNNLSGMLKWGYLEALGLVQVERGGAELPAADVASEGSLRRLHPGGGGGAHVRGAVHDFLGRQGGFALRRGWQILVGVLLLRLVLHRHRFLDGALHCKAIDATR